MSAKAYARINLRSDVTLHSCKYKMRKGLKLAKSRIRNSPYAIASVLELQHQVLYVDKCLLFPAKLYAYVKLEL